MTITVERRSILHCKCVHCGWEWDSFKKPSRCAKCLRYTWNGEDRRRADPFELVPPGSVLKDGRVPLRKPRSPLSPGHLKELIGSLKASRRIIEDLIASNPCDHPKTCVCEEKKVSLAIGEQIERLKEIIAQAKRNSATITRAK